MQNPCKQINSGKDVFSNELTFRPKTLRIVNQFSEQFFNFTSFVRQFYSNNCELNITYK